MKKSIVYDEEKAQIVARLVRQYIGRTPELMSLLLKEDLRVMRERVAVK